MDTFIHYRWLSEKEEEKSILKQLYMFYPQLVEAAADPDICQSPHNSAPFLDKSVIRGEKAALLQSATATYLKVLG